MTFEYLEHTADVIIHARGKNLNEAFEQAAYGFYNIITDISAISSVNEKKLVIHSEDFKSLLYDWLDKLIFLFDTEYFISNNISITEITQSDGKYTLHAILKGEEFQIGKHPQKTEVKAMTYSYMIVGDNFVEFTLDL